MDNLESSIQSIVTILKEKCPLFQPAIFPSYFHDEYQQNLRQMMLSSSSSSPSKVKFQTVSHGFDQVAIITEIDYPSRQIKISEAVMVNSLGKKLNSLETMIKLFIIGEDAEIEILVDTFFELNQLSYAGIKRVYVSEVYNLAYALKVIISNIPGLQVTLNGMIIPAPNDTKDIDFNTKELFNRYLNKTILYQSSQSNQTKSTRSLLQSKVNHGLDHDSDHGSKSSSNSDSEMNGDNLNRNEMKKKKKRRRGKH